MRIYISARSEVVLLDDKRDGDEMLEHIPFPETTIQNQHPQPRSRLLQVLLRHPHRGTQFQLRHPVTLLHFLAEQEWSIRVTDLRVVICFRYRQ